VQSFEVEQFSSVTVPVAPPDPNTLTLTLWFNLFGRCRVPRQRLIRHEQYYTQ
jgi:hypothetical protein